jgi:hypothetical protein
MAHPWLPRWCPTARRQLPMRWMVKVLCGFPSNAVDLAAHFCLRKINP